MNRNTKVFGWIGLMALGALLWQIGSVAQGPAVAAAAAAAASSQPADAPTAEPAGPPKPIVRVYKVWDLVQSQPLVPPPQSSAIAPNKLYEGAGKSGGLFNPDGSERDASQRPKMAIGALVAIMKDAIRFEEEVSIQCAEGMLIITALPDNHKKIEEFIGTLRKGFATRRTLSVRAVWVILDNENATKSFGSPAPTPQTLSSEVFKALEGDIMYQVSAFCQEGVQARMAAGRCETVVTDATPVVSTNTSAMNPTIQIVQWGPIMEITANPSDDGRSVNVELDSVVSEPNPTTTKALRAAGETLSTSQPANEMNVVKDIDKVDFLLHTIRSTMRVQPGTPVLVGGATISKSKSIYLVLEIDTPKLAP